MARQMERRIRCNDLLTVYQSGFRRYHSTAAAILPVTKKHSAEHGRWRGHCAATIEFFAGVWYGGA
jgi:hypothetical protein